jgi:hypothetical protein
VQESAKVKQIQMMPGLENKLGKKQGFKSILPKGISL